MDSRTLSLTARADVPTLDEVELRGRWLVRMRAAGTVVELAVVAVGTFALGVPRSWPLLAALVAFGIASNVHLAHRVRLRQANERWFAAVLVVDIVILTCLLAGTGGATNPFSVFFLVQVAMATVVLTGRRAIVLAVLTMIAFGTLFLRGSAEEEMSRLHHGGAFSIHLYGMWFAYVVAAAIVATFIARLVRALHEREQELAKANDARARAERVAATGTLAAGSAHELATPLATIALIATDLERSALDPERAREEGALLRREVDRCRALLDDLAGRSGAEAGDASRTLTVDQLFDLLRASLGAVAEKVELVSVEATLRAPVRPLVRALRNLVENALDASPTARVRAEKVRAGVAFSIDDEGPGIAASTLEHLGEPFFTTKPAGKGMGLGIYLVRSFADAVGGTLSVTTGEKGSTFVLEVPMHE